jgi:predicted deacylase
MARAFGLPCIVDTGANGLQTSTSPGVRIGRLELGIPAIFVEPRGEMVTRSESVEELRRGAYNVMKWLGMLPGRPEKPPFRTGPEKLEVKASMEGVYLAKAEPGTLVGEGQLLGKLVSISTLDVEEIRAPRGGFLYMNGRYERDGHTLNDLANQGETIAILMETLHPDDPSWQPSQHGLAYADPEGD